MYDPTYTECPEQVNTDRQDTDWWFPGAGSGDAGAGSGVEGGGNEEQLFTFKISFWGGQNVLGLDIVAQ